MNPLRTVSGLLQLPAHVAAAAAGTAVGVVTTGTRRALRVAGWAASRIAGPEPTFPGPRVTDVAAPPVEVPATPAAAPSPPSASEVRPPAPRTAAPRKAPARKAPARKAPARKAPASKRAPRKAPSRKAAVVAPALGLAEAEAEDLLRTPSGIPAAGDGTNPDTTETDLHQPGTEPLMDPSLTKAVASEAAVLQRAADPDKG